MDQVLERIAAWEADGLVDPAAPDRSAPPGGCDPGQSGLS
jgi:hypothetical protein